MVKTLASHTGASYPYLGSYFACNLCATAHNDACCQLKTILEGSARYASTDVHPGGDKTIYANCITDPTSPHNPPEGAKCELCCCELQLQSAPHDDRDAFLVSSAMHSHTCASHSTPLWWVVDASAHYACDIHTAHATHAARLLHQVARPQHV